MFFKYFLSNYRLQLFIIWLMFKSVHSIPQIETTWCKWIKHLETAAQVQNHPTLKVYGYQQKWAGDRGKKIWLKYFLLQTGLFLWPLVPWPLQGHRCFCLYKSSSNRRMNWLKCVARVYLFVFLMWRLSDFTVLFVEFTTSPNWPKRNANFPIGRSRISGMGNNVK